MPVPEPMVALTLFDVAQVPPLVVQVSGETDPAQILVVPEMAAGNGLTVTVAVLKQAPIE